MANLANFRTTYPHCTIETEWVGVEHGQYLVRCCIAQAGDCVASGLSAAANIETAEDQARDRALALLAQIGVPPLIKTQPIPIMQTAAPAAIPPPQKNTDSPKPLPSTPPEPALRPTQPVESVVSPLQPLQPDLSEPLPPEPVTAEPPQLLAPPPPPSVAEAVSSNGNGHLPGEEFSVEAPSKPAAQPTVLPDGTFDFTEIIAHTNREMRRLGWTKEQGRSYLIATYGKNSRTRLDNGELVEFLEYLKSLP
ncbi:MAG: hypothetical protein F6J87_00615 [Spirulina sp. SIO3F2]|nr:hypothetical protein [Spirulina sp. SIO3F2]